MKKIAFLFPGQGSQELGMGQSFYETQLAQDLFEQANESLGFDLKKMCFEGPQEQLQLTENGQPAILTVSTIAYRLFSQKFQIQPVCAAGHSLGEYSALVAAGVLDFKEAVRTVHLRGRYMQEAVPVGVGSMAAVFRLEPEALEKLCEEEAQGQVVSPANFNNPGQIVIAGHTEAIQRVLARSKGKALNVSAPFHCSLMQPAADRLKIDLEKITFSNAAFPVLNNADSQFLQNHGDFLDSLVRQVTLPVRWEETMRIMVEQGTTHMVEFGAGKVLAGLMKRINKNIPIFSVSSMGSLEKAAQAIEA